MWLVWREEFGDNATVDLWNNVMGNLDLNMGLVCHFVVVGEYDFWDETGMDERTME